MTSSYNTLVAALKLAQQALQNVPMVGETYDQQHSDTHLRATLALDDALNLAGEQEEAESSAIDSLLSEVDAHIDYAGDDDMATAADKVRALLVVASPDAQPKASSDELRP